jgi:hypothetical protein
MVPLLGNQRSLFDSLAKQICSPFSFMYLICIGYIVSSACNKHKVHCGVVVSLYILYYEVMCLNPMPYIIFDHKFYLIRTE